MDPGDDCFHSLNANFYTSYEVSNIPQRYYATFLFVAAPLRMSKENDKTFPQVCCYVRHVK